MDNEEMPEILSKKSNKFDGLIEYLKLVLLIYIISLPFSAAFSVWLKIMYIENEIGFSVIISHIGFIYLIASIVYIPPLFLMSYETRSIDAGCLWLILATLMIIFAVYLSCSISEFILKIDVVDYFLITSVFVNAVLMIISSVTVDRVEYKKRQNK